MINIDVNIEVGKLHVFAYRSDYNQTYKAGGSQSFRESVIVYRVTDPI